MEREGGERGGETKGRERGERGERGERERWGGGDIKGREREGGQTHRERFYCLLAAGHKMRSKIKRKKRRKKKKKKKNIGEFHIQNFKINDKISNT